MNVGCREGTRLSTPVRKGLSKHVMSVERRDLRKLIKKDHRIALKDRFGQFVTIDGEQ